MAEAHIGEFEYIAIIHTNGLVFYKNPNSPPTLHLILQVQKQELTMLSFKEEGLRILY